MKIGIYREFATDASEAGLGGAELTVAALAEGFEGQHDVEVIHNIPALTRERVEEFFGIGLRRTRFRLEQGSPLLSPGVKYGSRWPWKKYREEASRNAHLSKDFDIFFCITHYLPPFCHARDGVLIVLFPFFDRRSCWPWDRGSAPRTPGIKSILATLAVKIIWNKRFSSYKYKYSISKFVNIWTKKWWNIDSGVLYPPVDISARACEKRPVILSIGRFVRAKQQLEMVRTFEALSRSGMDGWSYHCVGGLDDSADHRAYFDEVRRAAGSSPASFIVNPRRADVESSLGSARIFWHAMGYNKDEETEPFAMEHFGIATVEAMAWGCVPVVVNRGGQPEIVRHGIDGFLWDTLEELEHYTRLLINDEDLRAKMSNSARSRAQDFGKQRFVREVADRCKIPLELPPES